MSNTAFQNAEQTPSDIKGHICLSFNGGVCCCRGQDGTGGGIYYTPSVSTDGVLSWTNNGGLPNPDPVNIKGSQGVVNLAVIAPQGTTWTNWTENMVTDAALPLTATTGKNYTLTSPFGKTPCIACVFVKHPTAGGWHKVPFYMYSVGSDYYSIGAEASVPGDGKVYIRTGTYALISNNKYDYSTNIPSSGMNASAQDAELVVVLFAPESVDVPSVGE